MYEDIGALVTIFPCCAYFAAGFIDSVAGGGGLLSIPAFLLAGVPADFVLGTNKLAVSPGTASSLITYAKKGFVIWKMAILCLPSAIIGGFAGSEFILLFDNANIGRIIVFLIPFAVLATFLPKKDDEIYK